jgi:uncharacterized protein
MVRTHGVKRLCAVWLGGAVLLTGAARAQTAAEPAREAEGQNVTVTGQKMPQAEAPRSATCAALAEDPIFRAQMVAAAADPLMGPGFYLPTRMPRNPDYSAPPTVPPGSALPDLPKSRFGVSSRAATGESGEEASDAALADFTTTDDSLPLLQGQANVESVVQACRTTYSRGYGGTPGGTISSFPTASSSRAQYGPMGTDPLGRVNASQTRFAGGRARIAAEDTTLPMAFALFDQARYAESLDWFRKAFDKLPLQDGGDEAALFIGKLYLQGLGDESDPAEGVKWLRKAATAPFNPTIEMPIFDPRQPERNTAVGEAAVILANVYRNGFPGIAKDSAEARRWYDRAADVGHVPALKMLGDIHHRGIDTPRDAKKAVTYYRKAAKLNHAGAQVALADILFSGENGVAKDRKEALGWYQAAAKNDHPDALYALARAYDFGEGVQADPQMALGFYKSAALHGSVAARAAMGTYFYEGKIVPKDDAMARKWFDAAAAQADPDGMFNLGAMMANGEGGQRDLRAAWMWLNRASRLGHADAGPAVAAIERRMTPADRQAAATMLGESKSEPTR